MLGGNEGDRLGYLRRSIDLLNLNWGIVAGRSAVYESEPWGFRHSSWFLNQVVMLETDYPASKLLNGVLQIEQTLGRVRQHTGYHARTMDIDILFYGNHVINTCKLTVPHPRIAERMFVLKPLSELSPGLIHPVLCQSMRDMKNYCTDTLQVNFYEDNRPPDGMNCA